MSQSVKHLLCKHGDLSSNPRTHARSQAEQCVITISVLGRHRQQDSWESFASLPSLTGEFLASERPCLRKQEDAS